MMKTLLFIGLLAFTFSCAKNKPEIYTAFLSQKNTDAPIANVVSKQKKNQTVVWKRIDAGIYQCDFSGFKSEKPIVFVSETSSSLTQVKCYPNESSVKVFTYEWNDDFKEWSFSDGILINTSIEFRFYK